MRGTNEDEVCDFVAFTKDKVGTDACKLDDFQK